MPRQSLIPISPHRAWGQTLAHSSLAQPVPNPGGRHVAQPPTWDGSWDASPPHGPRELGYRDPLVTAQDCGGTGGVQVEQGESRWGWVLEPSPSHAGALQSSRVRPSLAVAPWREKLVLMLSKSTWIVQSRPLCPHLEIIVFIDFRETVHGIKRFWQEPTSERPITTV